MSASVRLGFTVGAGEPVEIPIRHTVVTGQTQEAGKTTTLEALIQRAGVAAITFVTKRGEGAFANARRIDPYFREQADWQFVSAILEASRGEKLKFERSWIMRASKGAATLADVQRNVRKLMEKATGLSADVYFVLDHYLEVVVPQIAQVRWAPSITLAPGVNAMDLTGLSVELQHLVIKSTLDWVLAHGERTIVVVPEAWKFIPQGRNTPVKLAAEAFIRQAAGLGNYLWLDSQDIAGVEKMILKSVPVWILGVQREANEIKRTLDNIPAGISKPKAADIATLELGQFYACWGKHAVKTYVQPVWMSEKMARAVASADLGTNELASEENTVNEAEARALREENERLARRVAELEARQCRPAAVDLSTTEYAPGRMTETPARTAVDEDALFAMLLDRLKREAPAHLRVLVEKPELSVEVERVTIEAKGDSLRGRMAQLMAEGFFYGRTSGGEVQKELARRGFNTSPGSLYPELENLARLGFLRIDEGKDERSRPRKEFSLVDGMKINIVER